MIVTSIIHKKVPYRIRRVRDNEHWTSWRDREEPRGLRSDCGEKNWEILQKVHTAFRKYGDSTEPKLRKYSIKWPFVLQTISAALHDLTDGVVVCPPSETALTRV